MTHLRSLLAALTILCLNISLLLGNTYPVIKTVDDMTAGTLRAAVDSCNMHPGPDTITFDALLDGDTIKLTSTDDIDITDTIYIVGNGATNTIIDGHNNSRIFSNVTANLCTMSGLLLQNGNADSSPEGDVGGAILNNGTLIVRSCKISGNSVSFRGGGILNNGRTSLENSIISGNLANNGGGLYNMLGAEADFLNSTISGNTATNRGGGVYNDDFSISSFKNSIVALNSGLSSPDVYEVASTVLANFSLIGDNTGSSFPTGNGNIVGNSLNPIDPLFVMNTPSAPSSGGDLQLLPCSPAINAGSNGLLDPSDTLDLNGDPRVFNGMDSIVDMGAFEFQGDPYEPLIVYNTNDDGCGSLRYVVLQAMAGDTIRFNPSIDGDTIKLTSGQIVIDKDLTILGNDTSNTIVDACDSSRIFQINAGKNVFINGLTLQNGRTNSLSTPNNAGGGIHNLGNCTLLKVCIKYCEITGVVFGPNAGGGIFNDGILLVDSSKIEYNSGTSGGGIANAKFASINHTLIRNNASVASGGGIYVRDDSFSGGDDEVLIVSNSTIQSNNSVGSSGAGIYTFFTNCTLRNTKILGNTGRSSVYFDDGSTGNVYNTQISGNTTGVGGDEGSNIDFYNTTISGNYTQAFGYGISPAYWDVTLNNCIIAKNTGGNIGADIYFFPGDPISLAGSHNLIGDGTGQSIFINGVNGNIVGTSALPIDPQFIEDVPPAPSVFGNLRLQRCSPAVNAGNNAAVNMNDTLDLAGNPRIFAGLDSIVDMGAYEFQGAPDDPLLVYNTNDDGCGSLRNAVRRAMAGDTITFVDSINTDTIKLTSGQIVIDTSITILGNGKENTIIDADSNSRIFQVNREDTVFLSGLTLQNGASSNGGAISSSGYLSIRNSCLRDNQASFNGGAIYIQDNNTSTSDLFLFQCVISGNVANFSGGGIANVLDNGADNGRIIQSTISGNYAGSRGGGIAGDDGGYIIHNSILAGNLSPLGPDIGLAGSSVIGANNLIGIGTGTGFSNGVDGNIVGTDADPVDPIFVANVDTSSLPNSTGDLDLQACSPAINAGDNSILGTSDTLDLAGNTRIFNDADSIVDIGAFEYQGAPEDPLLVYNTNDDGCGSLRNAVRRAMAGDTITFIDTINTDTIKLTSGQIVIDTSITILGNDSSNTIVDACDSSRIFEINAGDTVVLIGMTLQNGFAEGISRSNEARGGAIFNNGYLSLDYLKLHSNRATTSGGAIYTTGTMLVNHSLASNNEAEFGGGINNVGGGLTINNSKLLRNQASSVGGGIDNFQNAKLTVYNSTISGNSASDDGGGVLNKTSATATFENSIIAGNAANNRGGGVYNIDATATFQNATISGNSASSGGGVYNIAATANFQNATISGNSAADLGGGVYNTIFATANFENSIIAKNTAPSGPDINLVTGSILASHSLIGDNSNSGFPTDDNNIIGTSADPVDPLFVACVPPDDSLGGDLRLLPCSPAINAGNNAVLGNGDTLDLDSNPRIFPDMDSIVDMGAYEFQGAPEDPLLVYNTNDDGCGSLRNAVRRAMAGDTITFIDTINTDTIKLTSGQILIDTSIYIHGNGWDSTIIDGGDSNRIFEIRHRDTVMITGVTIQNGGTPGLVGFPLSSGRGIYNQGHLTVNNSQFRSCIGEAGAAVLNLGISAGDTASATFNQCLFQDNLGSVGGAVFSGWAVSTFNSCEFTGNSVQNDGGSIFTQNGSTFINNSIIKGNNAFRFGGGIYNGGSSDLYMFNTEVSGNYAGNGGGGIWNSTAMTMLNSTISGNKSGVAGGGLCLTDVSTDADIFNSVIAKNQAPNGPDVQVDGMPLLDFQHSLVGDTTGSDNQISTGNGNILGNVDEPVDPLFVVDVDTMVLPNTTGDLRLKECSPAVDAGDNGLLDPLTDTVDLYGNDRIAYENVDMGSFEFPDPAPEDDIFYADCDPYCETGDPISGIVYIEQVGIFNAGLYNASGPEPGGYMNYTDFIADPGDDDRLYFYLGAQTSPHGLPVYWKVWIDYNLNDTFDIYEDVVTLFSNQPVLATALLPPDLLPGLPYRIRVSASVVGYPQACGENFYSETEDYTLMLSPDDPCAPFLQLQDEEVFGTYRSSQKIETSGDVDVLWDTEFQSREVELGPGFEVPLGKTFVTKDLPCD